MTTLIRSLIIILLLAGSLYTVEKSTSIIEQLTENSLNIKQRLDSFVVDMLKLSTLNFWSIQHIKMIDNTSLYLLKSEINSQNQQLQQWANHEGFLFNLNEHGVSLISGAPIIAAQTHVVLTDIQDLASYFTDLTEYVLPHTEIKFTADEINNGYKTRLATLKIQQNSLYDLYDLGVITDGLPISFINAEFEKIEQQQLTGLIVVKLYGI